MPRRERRYPQEDFARRGDAIYQEEVRPVVEAGNHGKIVAIDIETGGFEVDEDMVAARNRLFARFPDAQPWYVRIGYPAVFRFGVRVQAGAFLANQRTNQGGAAGD